MIERFTAWLFLSDTGITVLVLALNAIFWVPTLIAAHTILRRAGLNGWWTPLFLLYPISLWFLALRSWPALPPKST